MSKLFRMLAILLFAGAMAFWSIRGANRGWTKTSVPVAFVDEVTGIEGVRYEDRFVPGVDFLAGAVLGSVLLFGASFIWRNQRTKQT